MGLTKDYDGLLSIGLEASGLAFIKNQKIDINNNNNNCL
jgi:hypothetical protein